jgi:trehalose-6-phosphatase
MGDDKTDEDMFAVLEPNEKAFTIKIGRGISSAKYKLKNVQQVNQFLEKLQGINFIIKEIN